MDPSGKRQPLHSAEYFGEQRNYWWNQDFLALVAQRLRLGRAERVLDVGSGVGHWGRTILPHIAAGARMIGVDREPEWVRIAGEIAAVRGLDKQVRYVVGTAEHLPFPDAEFDLVTCQTLLLHVSDPRTVVREMVRVLRPGGRLLVIEPNNLASAFLHASPGTQQELQERLQLVRFQAICEYGKEQLGEGNNSIGDRLPGLFTELGLVGLEVYQSDHAYLMTPPYATPAQHALRTQLLDWADRGFWIWDKDDTRRYFIAGGGTQEEFGELWLSAMRDAQRVAHRLRDGTYCSAGGSVVYLLSAVAAG